MTVSASLVPPSAFVLKIPDGMTSVTFPQLGLVELSELLSLSPPVLGPLINSAGQVRRPSG